ncbi:MAG TPA: glycosyltransferase family 39 protein, partial [Candidatus Acidoferrales bacterium]|nr:glycosyltransferase family 39 protein [Candidatus Acidoferrales bacterium]
METEPGSAAGTSWLARHPLIVIGVLLAACLGPFLNQAIQTDDTLFVWTAQWIEKHPLDFFGFKVNWWSSAIPMWMANWNPPLWPYLLAGAGGLLGWNEIVLHSVGFVLAFVAAAGVYRLAWMWSEQPLLATAIAILTPAFFILSTTLMCDVTMCACWIWTVVIWERASANDESRWQFVGAGVVAGLAVLAKYSAITLLPLLAVFCLARRSNLAWKLAGLAVPVAMIAGYEWMTGRMYGHGLLSLASYYARADRFGFQGGWQAKGIIGLTFVGGSLLPLLFLAPWLWRFRTWTTSGLLLLGLLLGWFWLRGDPGLMHPWVDADGYLMKLWDFRLQVLLLTLAGLHVLLLAVAEMWQRRDRIAFLLVCWIGGVVFFATVLNWTVNARSFLPAVPAAA